MRKFAFLCCTLLLVLTAFNSHQTVLAQDTTPLKDVKIQFNIVGEGFNTPVAIANAGDGSGRLFIVEKAGKIMILKDGVRQEQPFLDIVSLVNSNASERGLLGLAFHPKYKDNGYFYVYYTAVRGRTQGDITIARYQVSSDPDRADPKSAKTLLQVPHERANHNGGQLAFGPDGYLYAGLGDGGAAGDPDENGQNVGTLLGKILRFDVDSGDPYGIPKTNPLIVNDIARPEVWDFGLRNPWRFSFDRETGDLYIADVGQDRYEEVDFEKAGSRGAVNYGWDDMEGLHCYDENPNCDPTKYTLPVIEYDHTQGISVTGGFVYRGKQFPNLNGIYFFTDFGTGNFWMLRADSAGKWESTMFPSGKITTSTFGEDENGEVYMANMSSGEIYQIVEAQ